MYIGGWDAAGERPGAADSGSDDSTRFSRTSYYAQGADSGDEGAFRHRGEERGSSGS